MFAIDSLKTLAAAAAIAVVASGASAATIAGGIEIGGQVTNASVLSATEVDFAGSGFNGVVLAATGDFATTNTLFSPAALTDILFTSPGIIWEAGGFTFTATEFSPIEFNDAGGKDFTAIGTIVGNGFAETSGLFSFSSQASAVLASFSSSSIAPAPIPLPAAATLLLLGLAGLGVAGKRRRQA